MTDEFFLYLFTMFNVGLYVILRDPYLLLTFQLMFCAMYLRECK